MTLLELRLCVFQVKKNLKEEPQGTAPQTDNPLDTVFVSSEVAPWSKTGGLGDVVGSLPIALAERGHRVMVVAPRSHLHSCFCYTTDHFTEPNLSLINSYTFSICDPL